MIDIDPRLDARLRAFYEHIEEQRPSRVTDFTQASRSKSRGLNVVLISAALAVVTVAVLGFAIELRAHLNHTAPVGPVTHATPTPSPTPAPTPGPLNVIPGNPVANAGFADPQVGAFTAVTSLPGWTVAGDVELAPASTIGEPFIGTQFLVLGSGPNHGEVTQRVRTVAGTNYLVMFTNGDSPTCHGPGAIDLYWNGRYSAGSELTPPTNAGASDLGWWTGAYSSALATSSITTLTFVGAGQCGASLNQVIVTPYPLPAG